jgi:hypothetical protein
MSFFKVSEWTVEFPEEKAAALAKEHHLPDKLLSRFAEVYRTICSDWGDFEYDEGDDIAGRFSELLGESDATEFSWMKAAFRIEAERMAKEQGFDSQKYCGAFDFVFPQQEGVDSDEEARQTAEALISGKLNLAGIENAADLLYAKMNI